MRNLRVLFTNEKHHFKEMDVNFLGEKISISVDAFGLFSKTYVLPRVILFKNGAGEIFSFKTLKIKVFNGNVRHMNKIADKYMTYEQQFRKNKFKIKSLLKDGLSFYY